MGALNGEHIRTGQEGERQAAVYLQEKGYTVLHRNYRYRRSEIDLIARQGNVLVFVEVKTRATNAFGFPEEAVTQTKEAMILKAADHYLQTLVWEHHVRFDIIAVTLSTPPLLHHIEDAFR